MKTTSQIKSGLRCPPGFKSKINRKLPKEKIADEADRTSGKLEAACRRIERQARIIEKLLKRKGLK